MDALVYDLDRHGMPSESPSLRARRDQALVLHRRGHFEHAIAFYKAYLQHSPEDPCIWSNLGACLRAQKKHQAALACYHRALQLEPENCAALGNLGNVLKDLHRLDDALAVHQRVLYARPEDVQALINHASALREHRQYNTALTQLDKASALDPDSAAISWERGQNLLHLGRYREGFEAYESRWQLADVVAPEFSFPQWQGESLTGKRILLYAEQGYGDTLLAARYIRLVKELVRDNSVYIVLQCKPELHRLFSGIGADRIIAPGQRCSDMDYHSPLMSLMAIFTAELGDVPPPARLYASLGAKKKFKFLRDRDPAYLKVGIVWSGSVTFKNNHNRCASVERFSALAELTGVRLYSFQKGPRGNDLYANGADAVIENLASYCDDFSDTAAAVEHMDVIVMTDSSLAHLAGSLGKPVINLLQYVPYWIYSPEHTRTPWYPSHRLIKQERPGEWDSVFSEARGILQRMASDKTFLPLS